MGKPAKQVFERYGYYRDYIKKIGGSPLDSTVKLKNLGLSAGATQMSYKEIEREEFPGNIVSYLNWVGGMFLLTLWVEQMSAPDDSTAAEPLSILDRLMNTYPAEAINLLRAVNSLRVPDWQRAGKMDWELIEKTYEHLRDVKGLLTHAADWRDGKSVRQPGDELKHALSGLINYHDRLQRVRTDAHQPRDGSEIATGAVRADVNAQSDAGSEPRAGENKNDYESAGNNLAGAGAAAKGSGGKTHKARRRTLDEGRSVNTG